MKFGICNLNCVAMRIEPCSTSEMTSQILFGETFKISKIKGNWIKIILDFDFYEGWVLKNQIAILDQESHTKIISNNSVVSNELVTFVSDQNNNLQTISLGATLPLFSGNSFQIMQHKFHFDGDANEKKMTKSDIVSTTFMYLNVPFLWGGRSPFGLDCSGFTQMVYKINGYTLLRNASFQASQGEVLSFIEESEPGDLAFFDNSDGDIIHVGIILADNYIIHCDGKVRIDRLDQSGIYNVDTKRHSHKLRVMKQLF